MTTSLIILKIWLWGRPGNLHRNPSWSPAILESRSSPSSSFSAGLHLTLSGIDHTPVVTTSVRSSATTTTILLNLGRHPVTNDPQGHRFGGRLLSRECMDGSLSAPKANHLSVYLKCLIGKTVRLLRAASSSSVPPW